MIILNESDFLTEGYTRKCYINPDDKSQILKIIKPECGKQLDINDIEKFYLSKVKHHGIIAECYQEVETNLGMAMAFEHVVDFNFETSKSISYYLREGIISKEKGKFLVANLFDSAINLGIYVRDTNLDNILMRKNEKGEFSTIFIDGYGAITFDYKLYRNIYFKFLSKARTKKTKKRALERVDNNIF